MMTNLLNGAHVANKLFSTIARLRLLLVMFLTLTVSANAWGADVTWNFESSDTELSNLRKDPISVSYAKNDGTNLVAISNSAFRLYKGSNSSTNGCSVTFTIASEYKIESITVVFKDGRTSARGKIDNGSYEDVFSAGSSKTVTISSLAAQSYSIQNQGSSTVAITSITITYSSNTSTPADPYTVTLVPGSGSVTNTELEEESAGDGVTLPTPTLNCGDWEFAGWKTTSAVSTETTTKPTLIAAGAYSPTSNITLYAVYQRTETTSGGGGGSTEVTFNFGYEDWGKNASFSGTTYSTVEQNKNGVSVTYTRNDGSLYANTTSLRLYKTNTLTFDAGSNTITSITFTGNIGQSDITTNAETCTNSTNTLSWAGSSKSVTFTRPSDASSYATLTSATLTIGSGSTTYYHSTPDCGSTEPSRCVTHKMRG